MEFARVYERQLNLGVVGAGGLVGEVGHCGSSATSLSDTRDF